MSIIIFYFYVFIEDIEVVNNCIIVVFNLDKGEIVVKMFIKYFEFENVLMQEYFNENYMELEKYFLVLFQGIFIVQDFIDLNKDGDYDVMVSGMLSIYGVE